MPPAEMPSITLSQLRNTRQLLAWLRAGITVELRERNRVIAHIVPVKRASGLEKEGAGRTIASAGANVPPWRSLYHRRRYASGVQESFYRGCLAAQANCVRRKRPEPAKAFLSSARAKWRAELEVPDNDGIVSMAEEATAQGARSRKLGKAVRA